MPLCTFVLIMAYSYGSKTVFASGFLEIVAYFSLWPLFVFKKFYQASCKRILLVEPFQMGDILSLTPMIAPLKEKYPDAKLYVLTKPSSGGILKFDSRIDEVLTTDFPWSDYGHKENSIDRLVNTFSFLWKLRSYTFDIGIDTRGDVRSQIILGLLGCKKRIGYTNYLHSNVNLRGFFLNGFLDKSQYTHRYEWNLELLTLLGIGKEKLLPAKFPSFVPDRLGITPVSEKYTVVHIGGGWEFKRWDNAKWAELINKLSVNGKKVYVIAGGGEKDILEEVQKLAAHADNVVFKITSFEELITYIAGCELFVGLDSGPMNLAVCLNRKVIGLYGPGDSAMWYPLNSISSYIHKKNEFPCSPCLQTVCIHPERSCMKVIETIDVLEII